MGHWWQDEIMFCRRGSCSVLSDAMWILLEVIVFCSVDAEKGGSEYRFRHGGSCFYLYTQQQQCLGSCVVPRTTSSCRQEYNIKQYSCRFFWTSRRGVGTMMMRVAHTSSASY